MNELQRVLRLSPHLRLERPPSLGLVLLLGELEHYFVHATDVAAVIGTIDGVRSVEQIIDVCAAEISPVQALQILTQLEAEGFLTEVRTGSPERLAFEARLPLPLAASAVELIDVTTGPAGGAVLRAMADALQGAGFQQGVDAGLRVIVATDYLAPACAEQAAAARRAGRACFLVKPGGLRPLFGPYFAGMAEEACPACLLHSLGEQRPVERFLQRAAPDQCWPVTPQVASATSLAAAANLAMLRLRTLLAIGKPTEITNRLWELDYLHFKLEEHYVRRRPQCPECGDVTLQSNIGERPVTLAPVPITFAEDGGFRRESPAESYARLRHLVSPLLGPVTRLQPMPGRHSESRPVFSSSYLVAPQHRARPPSFERRCAGKGCTIEQARMSALAEALERFSGVYRGDEAVVDASTAQLGDDAVHPAELHLFSSKQETAGGPAPPPLDSNTRIAWTPAWSLSDNRRRYIPLAYCYSEVPLNLGAGYCRPSSNGSAAGNCLEEAILQGLFEAVERDAAAIWWYCRIRRPPAQVPPTAAVALDAQRTAYATLGWTLWTLDLTHDLGLPVVVAVATHPPSDRLALGFGCHSEPALALRRALSELNQVFDPWATAASPWDGMCASKLDYLQPDSSAPRVALAAAVPSQDLRVHIETWVSRLKHRGLQTLIVDKTRPDLGLCVAQVIVPGLRHAWPRLGPGRLYTVPVALGWLPSPVSEEELNPEHLLI